jgi:hypothetical protein
VDVDGGAGWHLMVRPARGPVAVAHADVI